MFRRFILLGLCLSVLLLSVPACADSKPTKPATKGPKDTDAPVPKAAGGKPG